MSNTPKQQPEGHSFDRKTKLDAELYIIAYTDGKGTVTGFPLGGGTSRKPSVRGFDNPNSAQRSLRAMRMRKIDGVDENSRVMKVTRMMEAF